VESFYFPFGDLGGGGFLEVGSCPPFTSPLVVPTVGFGDGAGFCFDMVYEF